MAGRNSQSEALAPYSGKVEVLSREQMVRANVNAVLQEMPEASLRNMLQRLRQIEQDPDLLQASKVLLLQERRRIQEAGRQQGDFDETAVVGRMNEFLDKRREEASSNPPLLPSDFPEAV